MGTEIALSFSTLRTQLENEKSSLFKIDESIKKIVQTGRFTNDRYNNASNEYARGGLRLGGRNSYADASSNYNKNEEGLGGKRKHETKTVFSRLSARMDSDNEDEDGIKRVRVSSAVCRELPTRAAVLKAQGGDEEAKTRNRRIFGALLGTLQKFKQEEIVLQTKEDKKAQVERKIEEQARQQKEKEQQERKTLFAEREQKKSTIKALEVKMARVQEFELWENSHKSLSNFILTKSKPHVYWIPKKMSEKAEEKLNSSRKYHERSLAKKKIELQEELQRIEQRCLRPKSFGAKENDPDTSLEGEPRPKRRLSGVSGGSGASDDRARRRDKFAVDEDKGEDSDDASSHGAPKADREESKPEPAAEEPPPKEEQGEKREEPAPPPPPQGPAPEQPGAAGPERSPQAPPREPETQQII